VSAESFMRFLWGRMAFHWLIQGRIFGHGSCQAYIRVPRIVRVATEYILSISTPAQSIILETLRFFPSGQKSDPKPSSGDQIRPTFWAGPSTADPFKINPRGVQDSHSVTCDEP
jgi:hypothetical protein